MIFKLENDSFLSHNHKLIIPNSFSCSDVHRVIGPIECSVMEKNETSKQAEILLQACNRMHVSTLIPTLFRSRSFSFRVPTSHSTEAYPSLAKRRKKFSHQYIGFNSCKLMNTSDI
jgi:hypothetical protein